MPPSTLFEWQEYLQRQLIDYYSQREAKNIAVLLLEEVTGQKQSDWSIRSSILSKTQKEKVERVLQELQTGRPVQYVLGKTEFYGLPLMVDERALIPRPETEELVNWALDTYQELGEYPRKVWDIGTGCGGIALALKKHWPEATALATDVTEDSLNLARENAQNLQLTLHFYKHNILEDPPPEEKFDLIVSNPPYVLQSDVKRLSEHVKTHEPSEALFVPDEAPLLFYRAILEATSCLKAGGNVFVETHEDYGPSVRQLFEEAGFAPVVLRKDLSGFPRMVRAVKAD